MTKTIAVFGAGGGMGLSLARRFGREGYRVALVARRREPLEKMAAELAGEGTDAAAFVADLRRTGDVAALVEAIRDRLGRIDEVVYSPFTPATLIPATQLDAAMLREWVELVRAVLPEMLRRGSGSIVTGYGYSVIEPSAGHSGPVPVLAAARHYIHTLHDELAGHGVYAGAVAVRALIAGSQAQQAVREGEMRLAGELPVVDPAELADLVWTLVGRRDLVEVVHP